MSERRESGPVRFGHDWPGVFIRGDDALMYANVVELIAVFMQYDDGSLPLALVKLLRSCKVKEKGDQC